MVFLSHNEILEGYAGARSHQDLKNDTGEFICSDAIPPKIKKYTPTPFL
jgi:hypothetical protein